jgi:predicted DCC family thiol-disulfide oxidoreductase YuxK
MDPRSFPLTLLYDASCPVCAMEMHALRARDLAAHGQAPWLRLVDISAPGFDPAPYGASLQETNALIHAARPDGSIVIGLEALRLAYSAAGIGHWLAPTGWRWLQPAADWAYAAFAARRYGFSRAMGPVIQFIEHRRSERAAQRALIASQACHAGKCELNHASTSSTLRNTP